MVENMYKAYGVPLSGLSNDPNRRENHPFGYRNRCYLGNWIYPLSRYDQMYDIPTSQRNTVYYSGKYFVSSKMCFRPPWRHARYTTWIVAHVVFTNRTLRLAQPTHFLDRLSDFCIDFEADVACNFIQNSYGTMVRTIAISHFRPWEKLVSPADNFVSNIIRNLASTAMDREVLVHCHEWMQRRVRQHFALACDDNFNTVTKHQDMQSTASRLSKRSTY